MSMGRDDNRDLTCNFYTGPRLILCPIKSLSILDVTVKYIPV